MASLAPYTTYKVRIMEPCTNECEVGISSLPKNMSHRIRPLHLTGAVKQRLYYCARACWLRHSSVLFVGFLRFSMSYLSFWSVFAFLLSFLFCFVFMLWLELGRRSSVTFMSSRPRTYGRTYRMGNHVVYYRVTVHCLRPDRLIM